MNYTTTRECLDCHKLVETDYTWAEFYCDECRAFPHLNIAASEPLNYVKNAIVLVLTVTNYITKIVRRRKIINVWRTNCEHCSAQATGLCVHCYGWCCDNCFKYHKDCTRKTISSVRSHFRFHNTFIKRKKEYEQDQYLKILRMATVGAVVGGSVGSSLILPRKVKNPQGGNMDSELHQKIINLHQAPDAKGVISRMMDYKVLDPAAFQELRLFVDRLVGIYLLVSGPGMVKAGYELAAHRYRCGVEIAIQKLSKNYFGGTPSKQFTEVRICY